MVAAWIGRAGCEPHGGLAETEKVEFICTVYNAPASVWIALAVGRGFTQRLGSHKQTCNDDTSYKHTYKRNSITVPLQNNSLLFHLLEVPVSIASQSGQSKAFMRWVIRVPRCPEHRTAGDTSNGNRGMGRAGKVIVRGCKGRLIPGAKYTARVQ